MADTAITRATLGNDISYRQSQMPVYSYGTFEGDDTDYHVLKVDGRGKGRLTYGVDNATNKEATVTLYGAHSIDADVDDTGVFAIDAAGLAVAATSADYDTSSDSFPFYLICVKFAATPNGPDVTVYANSSI